MFETMNKKVKNMLVGVLKGFRNELSDDAKDLRDQVLALVTELENSEEEVDIDSLADRIKTTIDEGLAAKVENMVRRVMNEAGQTEDKARRYFNSKQAHLDFGSAIFRSRDSREFSDRIKEALVKNGITGTFDFGYEVSSWIANKWQRENGLLGRIRKVSDREFKILYTADDEFTYSSSAFTKSTMALGHAKGTEKQAQIFEVAPKALNIQGIYKDLPVDRVDLARMEDDEAFIRWVITELSDRLAYTIERTIIAGNPYASIGGGTNNYNITSFESIATKASTDAWTTVKSITGAANVTTVNLLTNLLELSSGINNRGGEKWLYINPSILTTLQIRTAANTAPQVAGLNTIAAELGVDRVIPYAPLTYGSSAGTYNVAVIITPDEYYRVGGEPFGERWTIYNRNQEAFRAEVFAGGGIGTLGSTAVLKAVIS